MNLVHKVAGLPLNQVGRIFGIHRFGASKTIGRIERELKKIRSMQRLILKLTATPQAPVSKRS